MPLYEYRCRDRGHVFDSLRAIDSRDDRLLCPLCNSEKVVRLIGSPFSYYSHEGPEESVETGPTSDENPSDITLENISVVDSLGGVKFDGVKVRGRDWHFKNIRGKTIDSKDSDVEVDGEITIE